MEKTWILYHPHMHTAYRYDTEAEARAALAAQEFDGWRVVDLGNLVLQARVMLDEYERYPDDHRMLQACANGLDAALAQFGEVVA